jgi:DNA methylase
MSEANALRSLNAVCPYYTMFPLTFPLSRLRYARPGDWVLDPFCGRGTTNFAARLRGLNSIGMDISPVAVAIAKAKFAWAAPDEVARLAASIIRTRTAHEVPEGEFWTRCFHPHTLRDICKLRESLVERCDSDTQVLLRAVVLGILHGPRNVGKPTYLSNQMPRTYATKPTAAIRFWKAHELRARYVDAADAIERRCKFSLSQLPPRGRGMAVSGDSVNADFRDFGATFKWVITSPPYFQMNTYVSDQWLRAWFVGGSPDVDYSTKDQAGTGRPVAFEQKLSHVWTNIARSCRRGAHLYVRLGSIPSSPSKAAHILRNSVTSSDAGWHIRSVRSAGHAGCGKRQADQFGIALGGAIEEFDLHAVLGG